MDRPAGDIPSASAGAGAPPMARIPGELLIAFAAIAWGSAYPATTLVLEDLPPVGAASWRGGLSAIVMIGILLARGEGRHLLIVRRQILPLVVLGGLGGRCSRSA